MIYLLINGGDISACPVFCVPDKGGAVIGREFMFSMVDTKIMLLYQTLKAQGLKMNSRLRVCI